MMNLKYYLRGLGIGIVVTALIMGIVSGSSRKEPSDTEIKKRARELGMVEGSTVLAEGIPDVKKESAAESTTEPTEEPAAEAEAEPIIEPIIEPTIEPIIEPTIEPTTEPTAEPTAAPTEKPAEKPVGKPSGENITVAVNKGEGSYTICKRLEDAGLIFSASDFDHYLCEHGYDRRMRVGSFQIPPGADPEQIARILTGSD